MTTQIPLDQAGATPDTHLASADNQKKNIQDTLPDPNATQIERRSDLSLFYRFLRTFILRPLRPRLVGFKGPLPQGSPPLEKRPASHYGVHIKERTVRVAARTHTPLTQATGPEGSQFQELYLYDFEPARDHSEIDREGTKKEYRHTVYYFSGGGFCSPAGAEHWKLCARMAKNLAGDGVRIVLVSYPLAPNSPAKDSLPLLRNWLLQALEEAVENARADETITLMGDSAGGNVALSLGFWWSEQFKTATTELEEQNAKLDSDAVACLDVLRRLKSVVPISPPTDFRNTNPEIARVNKIDPVMNTEITTSAADRWTKDWQWANGTAKADPILSAALTEQEAWVALRQSKLRVDGLFGTADVLAPDCEVFMEACKKAGIPGKWLVWEGQMHCFPLIQCYGVAEGKEGHRWLCDRVKEVL